MVREDDSKDDGEYGKADKTDISSNDPAIMTTHHDNLGNLMNNQVVYATAK